MKLWIKTPYPYDEPGDGKWVECTTPYDGLPTKKQEEHPDG